MNSQDEYIAKGWDAFGKLLSASSSLLDKILPSLPSGKAAASPTGTLASATPAGMPDATIATTQDNLATLDLAFILNAATVSTWQENLTGNLSNIGNSFLDFLGKAGSALQFTLSLGSSLISVASAYNTLKELDFTKWIKQTQLYTTAQTLFTKAIDFAKRGIYIYQMQVLTAKAAVTATTGATRILNMVMAASPWGLAIAAAAALCAGIYMLVSRNSEAAASTKRLNASLEESEKNITTEQLTLDRLFGALQGAKEGSEEWNSIRDTINDKYGDYLQKMGIEIKDADSATLAYKKLSESIRETARQRAMDKAMGEAGEAYAEKEAKEFAKIREKLASKYGEKEGTRLFVQLRDSVRAGGEIPEELKQQVGSIGSIMRGLNRLKDSKANYDKEIQDAAIIFGKSEKPTSPKETNTSKIGTGDAEESEGQSKTSSAVKDKFQQTTKLPTGQGGTADNTLNESNPIGNAISNANGGNSAPSASSGGTVKNINVSIGKLIEKFEITTGNIREDANRIRELVTGVLVDAVNDLNTAI